MRIYGNRLLKTVAGGDTRPTTGKVREALFNVWREKVPSASWLDLCAGNGTMGAEALCRGAKKAVAIEKSAFACKIIRENWQKVSQPSQEFKVLKGDVLSRLKNLQGNQFDLIYFDPPYHQNLYNPVLQLIIDYNLLNPHTGEIAVEYDPKKSILDDRLLDLNLIQTKFYGKTALNFYQTLSASV